MTIKLGIYRRKLGKCVSISNTEGQKNIAKTYYFLCWTCSTLAKCNTEKLLPSSFYYKKDSQLLYYTV